MNYYMLSCKKEPACPVGKLDAVLYDKAYGNWSGIEYGYFPWYSNSVRRQPHEKLPAGLVLVGQSKKYLFGVRRLIRDLYVLSDNFKKACELTNVNFIDVEAVDFRVSAGAHANPVSYCVGMFESYSSERALDASSIVERDEFNKIISFSRLVISDNVSSPLFKIQGLRPKIDTLFCSEEFKIRCVELNVRGIDFLPLSTSMSSALDSV